MGTLTKDAVKGAAASGRKYRIADHKINGLHLRVAPGGAKTYIIMYRDDAGKLRECLVGRADVLSLDDARRVAQRMLAGRADGIDPRRAAIEARTKAKQRDQNTMRSFAADWQLLQKLKGKAQNTRIWEDTLIRKHILPRIGDMPLAEIRRADILRVMEQVAEFSGPSNSNKVHTLVVMILNSAVERELVQSNVALGIRKLFRLQPRDRVLSDTELKTLWRTLEVSAKGKASDGHGFHSTTARALQVCLLTGQRRQEIADMKWSEIDLPGKLWMLPRERSKNRKAHTVPLTLPVCEILQAARAAAPKSSWVFPTPIGSHSDKTTGQDPIPGMALRTALARFAAEHDWPALGPHDLRRTMATRMAEEPLLGSSDVIGWILNHAPQGVTRQVYVRANYLPQARTLMQAWADVLATLTSKDRL